MSSTNKFRLVSIAEKPIFRLDLFFALTLTAGGAIACNEEDPAPPPHDPSL